MTTATDIGSRIDRLPTTRYLWTLMTVMSCGAFFEVYDLLLTGYIAPGMVKSGLLSNTTSSFFGLQGIGGFIAVFFAGLFIGTAGLGRLGDRFGRRAVFTYALLAYSIASAVMAFQTSFEGLFFWRFLSGMGVGLEIITIGAYVTELVPHRMRGKAIAYCFAIGFTAAPVCGILSYWLVPQTIAGLEGWRWVVLIGSVGAVLVWVIRLGLPESPRWLAERGEIARSEVILARIEARVARDYGRPLPMPEGVSAVVSTRAGFVTTMSRSPYRARVLMLLVFNFFQAIGYYGFGNWVPTLLINQGITVTKSLLYSSLIAIALPVSCFVAMALVERVERKWLIVGGALAVVVCGLLFSRTTDSFGLIALGVLITLAGQIITVAFHVYQAELFPTSMRSGAVGVVYSASRLGAMLSGFVIAYLLRDFGVFGVFAGITGCMLVVVVSIGLFGPRTNGMRLEQISA